MTLTLKDDHLTAGAWGTCGLAGYRNEVLNLEQSRRSKSCRKKIHSARMFDEKVVDADN